MNREVEHILLSMLASCGRCNTVPQTWWLKTVETYSLTVLEARSFKSKCQHGYASSGGPSREFIPCLFQLLVAAGIPLLGAASLQSLPLSSPHLSCVFSPLLSASKLLLALMKIHMIARRVYIDNPGLSSSCQEP